MAGAYVFSEKQQLACRWWIMDEYKNYDAVICDGAVRSGKTFSMSIGFISWAMTCFNNCNFAICGKTIKSLKRNVLDDLINKCKSGIIIPITGFAHSITSSALDYKNDGLITGLGSNFFKLAGSVILYAIISGFFMGIVKVILNV